MDPQEESSRSSVYLPHPETSQPEGPSCPDIESPVKTPVLIKQLASLQKPQKLPEIIYKPSELSEPSESDESDSDILELHRLPILSLQSPRPDPDSEPELSNELSYPTLL